MNYYCLIRDILCTFINEVPCSKLKFVFGNAESTIASNPTQSKNLSDAIVEMIVLDQCLVFFHIPRRGKFIRYFCGVEMNVD